MTPDPDEDELPPDYEEANRIGDLLWRALSETFRVCDICELPVRPGQVKCPCGRAVLDTR